MVKIFLTYKRRLNILRPTKRKFLSISIIKTYELRKNDRCFSVGDFLLLKETEYTGEEMANGNPLEYTGRQHEVQVIHILSGPIYGLEARWVIMSICDC